jgi:hypothetical protein
MFKFDLLNYKINSYILLLLSLLTVLFDVTYLNQLLFISVLIFSILQNTMQYKFKTIVSSIFALIFISLQFNLSAYTFSKEFFLNLILILVFIKFSEIKKKQDHYFFNFTVIFLTISSLIYGQDFLSSINSFLLMFVSIIHLYSLNQKQILNINTKYIFQYLSISLLILPIMALVYFVFPRYEINIKIFDTQKNTLGIPEKLKLGSFTDITNNNQVIFNYSNDDTKDFNDILYFRVKIFDLLDKDKSWITTPNENITFHYGETHKLVKKNNILNKNAELIIYPNDKTWLPVLKGFDFNNNLVSNNYLNGTAVSRQKISKKNKYTIQSSKFSVKFDKEFLNFYQSLPNSTFSKKLITWSDELRSVSKSDSDYLNNIMKHFGSGEYYYTLTPNVDETNDYEKFFFETKSGYCEYYAGMFAILARLQNIPSRIVTGYLAGEYNDLGNFYTFRQSDAHSWVEVYTNDKGWIRFDPTLAIPNKNIVSFNNTSLGGLQSNKTNSDSEINKIGLIKLYYNYFDYTWTNKFLDYNKQSRSDFIKKNFENMKFNNKFYIYLLVIILAFFLYKMLNLVLKKKLFFSILFKKIRKNNSDINETMTHQEIFNFLKKEERLKLNEIFEFYEKINFSNNFNVNTKNFFHFNYKIIKFYLTK